jgi:hypothetical protein
MMVREASGRLIGVNLGGIAGAVLLSHTGQELFAVPARTGTGFINRPAAGPSITSKNHFIGGKS